MSPVCIRCGTPLSGRADAVYCGRTCKREAARHRKAVSALDSAHTFPWWDLRVRGPVAVARGRSRYAPSRRWADA